MSNFEPLFNEHDQQEIIVADIVEPSPLSATGSNRSFKSCLLPGLLIGGVFLMCIAGIAIAFRTFFVKPEWSLPDVVAESNDEKAQATFEVFSQDASNAKNHPEYTSISRFVARMSKVAEQENTPQLLNLIDIKNYVHEVRHSGYFSIRFPFSQLLLEAQVKSILIGPITYDDFEIYQIEPLSRDKVLVYLQFSNGATEVFSSRWWLVRNQSRWRLYDWEELNYGLRDSHELAIRYVETNRLKIDNYERYVTLCTRYLETEGNYYDRAYRKEMANIFRQCEGLTVMDRIQPVLLYDTAIRWQSLGQSQDALRCLSKIKDLDLVPGAYQLKGNILLKQMQFEEALKNYQQYLPRVGPGVTVLTEIAVCQQALNDLNDEYETRFKLLAYDRNDDSENLFRLVTSQDDERCETILKRVAKLPNANGKFVSLTRQLSYVPIFSRELLILHRVVSAEYPGSSLEAFVQGHLLLAQAKIDEGVHKLAESLQLERSESDEDSKWLYAVCDTAVELGQAIKLFQRVEYRADVFDTLLAIYEEYEYDFSATELCQLAELNLQSQPDDATANYHAGSAFSWNSDYKQAIIYLEKALSRRTEEHPWFEDARSELANCYLKIGNIDAFQNFAKNESLIQQGFWHVANKKNHSELLGWLLEQLTPDNPAYEFYSAIKALNENDLDQAETLLAKILNDSDDHSYAWQARYRFVELHRQRGDVVAAFEAVPSEEILEQVLHELFENRNWNRIDRLIELVRQSKKQIQLDSPDRWKFITVRSLFEQRRYRELLDFVQQSISPTDGHLPEIREVEWIVRAAIRVGDYGVATRWVERLDQDEKVLQLKAVLALHQGNLEKFKEIRQQLPSYSRDFFHYDDDTKSFLETDLAELSRQFPRHFYSHSRSAGRGLELLLRCESNPDFALLQQQLCEVFNIEEDSVQLIPLSDPDAIYVADKRFQMALALQPASYKLSDFDDSQPLLDAFSNHTHLLTIQYEVQGAAPVDSILGKVAVLGITLAEKDLLAIGYNSQWLLFEDVVNSQAEETTSSIKSEKEIETLFAEKKGIRAYPTSDQSEAPAWSKRAKFWRELFEASTPVLPRADGYHVRTLSDNALVQMVDDQLANEPVLYLYTKCFFGKAEELLKFKAIDLRHSLYSWPTYRVELQTDSVLNPQLKAGAVLLLDMDDIHQWELEIQGKKSGAKLE